MTAPVLEVSGLSKAYGRRLALDALELELGRGELVALLGENGAGKTTTLAILSGQLVPDAGAALILGHDVFAAPLEARRHLGYVAQDLQLPPYLTVEELAEFVCGVKRVPLDRAELARLLALTELAQDGNRLVGELSHGMQRKSAWVVALVSQPELLVIDEGLAGVDARSSRALVTEVVARVRRGTAALWTEHDLDLLAPHLDRALLLHRGRLARVASGDAVRAAATAGELERLMRVEGGAAAPEARERTTEDA